jgi:hypothetical protein
VVPSRTAPIDRFAAERTHRNRFHAARPPRRRRTRAWRCGRRPDDVGCGRPFSQLRDRFGIYDLDVKARGYDTFSTADLTRTGQIRTGDASACEKQRRWAAAWSARAVAASPPVDCVERRFGIVDVVVQAVQNVHSCVQIHAVRAPSAGRELSQGGEHVGDVLVGIEAGVGIGDLAVARDHVRRRFCEDVHAPHWAAFASNAGAATARRSCFITALSSVR